MTKSVFPIVLVACLLAGATAAIAESPGEKPSGAEARSPRIDNRVFDLLDDEVVLDTQTEVAVWESMPFDTSQFNRIGLQFSADVEQAPVTCRVCWRYSLEDEFTEGIPAVTRGNPVVPPDFGWIGPDDTQPSRPRTTERPDGTTDLYLEDPRLGLSPSVDFTEVRGLWGQVRCSLPMIEIVPIGDDQSISDLPELIPLAATLTDVKVLLRRE